MRRIAKKPWNSFASFKERLRPPFHFYNVSLHAFADASEKNFLGVAPNGSLLEWIDSIYETPADLLERTMGKWSNVLSVKNVFNRELIAGGYMSFLRYDLSCDSLLKHGEVAS